MKKDLENKFNSNRAESAWESVQNLPPIRHEKDSTVSFGPGEVLNTWLPMDQFNTDKYLREGVPFLGFQTIRILVFGYEVDDPSKEMRIWPLQSLYRHYEDNSICYSTEIWAAGNWLDVIPVMFMEVSVPQVSNTEKD